MRTTKIHAATLCALALGGCLDRDLEPLNPCTFSGVVEKISIDHIENVDVLFVVDNSGSMAEEQISLAEQLPRMVQTLASGDLDLDGDQDFPPVKSLHVGVVSTDMGTGGFRVPTCSEPNFGDDGVLLTAGNTARAGCMATYPSFLRYETGSPMTPAQVASDFTCVAAMGTGGCGFEQQLEAALKAVTPGASEITFAMGTRGHADLENAGFLRDDSALAVIVVTDEEDCSFADAELANPASSLYPGDLNLRCFSYPDAVHPVQRYVDGLLATRERDDLLVFAAIAGVPPDLVADPDHIDYDAILADRRMDEVPDPTMPTRLAPSCNVPGRGIAFPPRRIVRVAQALEQRGTTPVVQSICQSDFGPALGAIIRKLADKLRGACLPRDLNPDASGMVRCDVVELLPTTGRVTRCADVPGRTSLGIDPETGRERCGIAQRRVTDVDGNGEVDGIEAPEPGWYYDTFTRDVLDTCGDGGQRISFTPDASPVSGTEVRLECLQPATAASDSAFLDVGTPCVPETAGVCTATGELVDGRSCRRALACDPVTREYATPCASDADCTAADLAGFRCDGASGFCANPTC